MNIQQIERRIRTIPGGNEYLKLINRVEQPIVNRYDILAAVLNVAEMSVDDIMRRTRKMQVVQYRHMYFFLCSYYHVFSCQDIGREFELDHTTVLHGRNRVCDLLDINDPQTVDIFNKCKELITKASQS